MYYIYFHINPLNNDIFYVGRGKYPKNGYNKFRRAYVFKNRSNAWLNYYNKYGIRVQIIEVDIDESNIDNREIFYIKKIGRRDLNAGTLVNLTDGGDGIKNISATTREKMKLNHANVSGINNPMYGKHFNHTDKTKIKISESSKGRKRSEETKEKFKGENNPMYGKHFNHTEETKLKISNSQKGKKISEDQKIQISNKLKGRTSPMKGRKISETTKIKKSISRCNKKIVQLDLFDNIIKTWNFPFEIRQSEFNYPTVHGCCTGIRKTHGGFKWKFIE